MSKQTNYTSFPLLLLVIVLIPIIFILKYILPLLPIVYLIWVLGYYNRKNCQIKINLPHLLDEELTKKILAKQGVVEIGSKDEKLKKIRISYENTLKSNAINKCKNSKFKIDNISKKPFQKYHIKCLCKPLILRFARTKRRGFVFYVFPKTILAFVEGPEAKVFIGAYNPQALSLCFNDTIYPFSVVVHERTKNPIHEYYSYNPIPDAPIIACDWSVTNADGSRSFRGGLLPEHNPLNFELKYMQVNYIFGQLSTTIDYSNYEETKKFANSLTTYLQDENDT
ncbi:MAG: hypothetical protein IKA57_00180 [Clostridia bacterium]|nr:hypothetical protein [Clostridia bacterium]